MPRTTLARAVIATLLRPGVWKRASMGGDIVGLDITESLASLPDRTPRDLAREYLIVGERALLTAIRRSDADKDPANGK